MAKARSGPRCHIGNGASSSSRDSASSAAERRSSRARNAPACSSASLTSTNQSRTVRSAKAGGAAPPSDPEDLCTVGRTERHREAASRSRLDDATVELAGLGRDQARRRREVGPARRQQLEPEGPGQALLTEQRSVAGRSTGASPGRHRAGLRDGHDRRALPGRRRRAGGRARSPTAPPPARLRQEGRRG
jgi:hypothetical protein